MAVALGPFVAFATWLATQLVQGGVLLSDRTMTWLCVPVVSTMTACAADDRGNNPDDGMGLITDSLGSEGEGNEGLDVRFDLGVVVDGMHEGSSLDEGVDDEERQCDIDFLFVIDNSGSMADEQSNLSASVPEFIATVTQELPELDTFHLGVITTDAYSPNGPNCQVMGGLVTKTGGMSSSNASCGPYANGASFMSDADDLYATFPCAASVGVSGDGDEKPMLALGTALSDSLLQDGACNHGFLRDDALLVVTVITDEEDDDESSRPFGQGSGSPGGPADWYQAVLAAKGGALERVVVLGLLGTEPPNACDRTWNPGDILGGVLGNGAEVSARLRAFVEMFGERGVVGDVCAPNYDPFFDAAVSVIDFACDNIIPPAR